MTALEELRAADLGAEFVKVLYRQVAIVAKAYRFPPPDGHGAWTVDAVQETAHDFLVAGAQTKLIVMAARVDNGQGLERLMSTMLRNFLRQRGRRTTLGKLIVRLKSVLNDDQFDVAPEGVPGAGNYTLAGGTYDPFAGPTAPLAEAARLVSDVTVVRWRATAKREGPVADAPSLRALSAAVLSGANGSVDIVTLAEVIATRLGIDPRTVPAALAVEDIDDLTSHGDAVSVGTAVGDAGLESTEQGQATAAILEQLSLRERLVLACLHETVRVIADQTGLAVSTSGAVKQRVTDKLRSMLADIPADEAENLAVAARDAARREVGFEPV